MYTSLTNKTPADLDETIGQCGKYLGLSFASKLLAFVAIPGLAYNLDYFDYQSYTYFECAVLTYTIANMAAQFCFSRKYVDKVL